MKFSTTLILTVASAFAISACASKGYADGYGNNSKSNTTTTATVVTKVNTDHGEVFATADGLTLYIFTKDKPGVSNCYDGCAANWPPFMASKEAKEWSEFTKISRKDGSLQWAYKDQPLYRWLGDQKKGDTFGQGVGNVWYVVNTPK